MTTPSPSGANCDRHRVRAVVAVERDVVRHEQATGRPGERPRCDRSSSWRSIGAHVRTSITPPVVLVDPAAAVRRHLVRGRHVQQVVAVVELDEDALSTAA